MSNTAQIVWKCIGIGIMVGLLITAVWSGYKMRPADAPCVSVSYIIEDLDERAYVTKAELNQMLQETGLYPVGKHLNILSLHKIEQAIGHHPMVRTAECYLTPRNEMRIRLTQRVPLLRVQVPGDTYLIDTDRRVMEARGVVRDSVLLVTGAIGAQTAATTMAEFAQWLQRDRYWREKIDLVRVQTPQMVYIYVHDRPRIVLGSMHGYERKLAKMRRFYENAEAQILKKEYKEYDVRFKGQVIGRKNNQ